jgi:phospholipid/cholesterol/gamma-HCH transport system substrate-binding protein
MNDETRVGIFVLAGMALFGMAIFLLGDYSFQTYYPMDVEFQDVAGLPDKAAAKLSGVEAGKIKKIFLQGDKVIVKLAIRDGVRIYRDAKFQVGSTSLIGSKFLQIDQGSPSAGVFEPGARALGENFMPVDRVVAKAVSDLQGLISDIRGNGRLASDLNEIMGNLREVTANINDLVSTAQPHAEKAAERLDGITAKLDSILARTDALLAKVENGEGVAGALVADKKMKDDVTATLGNIKDASVSVKNVLGRFSGFRTYWNWQLKYEPLARDSKNDFGVRIYPRDNRYYYLGGANIINRKDQSRGVDYETMNTVDALLGWELKGFDLYAGVLRGAGGVGVKYRPFYGDPKWDRFRFLFEAADFSRRRVIRDRDFDSPRYDAGLELIFNRYVAAGVRVNDLAEVKRVNYTAHVMFEDKDISYLLGLASFGGGKSK